eukprot:scaffold60270_cov41-Tisochrysis_lutea.AAC.5
MSGLRAHIQECCAFGAFPSLSQLQYWILEIGTWSAICPPGSITYSTACMVYGYPNVPRDVPVKRP